MDAPMTGSKVAAEAGTLIFIVGGDELVIESLKPLFAAMASAADVIVLCGDLTDYGTADEARVLAAERREPRRHQRVGHRHRHARLLEDPLEHFSDKRIIVYDENSEHGVNLPTTARVRERVS